MTSSNGRVKVTKRPNLPMIFSDKQTIISKQSESGSQCLGTARRQESKAEAYSAIELRLRGESKTL